MNKAEIASGWAKIQKFLASKKNIGVNTSPVQAINKSVGSPQVNKSVSTSCIEVMEKSINTPNEAINKTIDVSHNPKGMSKTLDRPIRAKKIPVQAINENVKASEERRLAEATNKLVTLRIDEDKLNASTETLTHGSEATTIPGMNTFIG